MDSVSSSLSLGREIDADSSTLPKQDAQLGRKLPTVLAVTYGGGHVAMIASVVEELLSRGQCRVDVLGLTTARPYLVRRDIPTLGCADFLVLEDRAARRYGKVLAHHLHQDHSGMSREESQAYLGLSYADLVGRLGAREARKRFNALGRKGFEPFTLMERVFDAVQPDLLLTTNSPRAELAAREIARKRNIPSIVLTDLIGEYLQHQLTADVLVVSSDSSAANHAALPIVDARDIRVLGNPAMDYSCNLPKRSDARIRAFPNIDAAAKMVLIGEQEEFLRPNSNNSYKISDEVRFSRLDCWRSVARQLDFVLAIRPHPSMDPEPYRSWIAKHSDRYAVMADPGSVSLQDALAACDIVVANTSTIILDGMFAGRPTAVLRLPNADAMSVDKWGCAYSLAFEPKEALIDGLRDLLFNPDVAKRLRSVFRQRFPAPPAAPRIADAIDELLSSPCLR